MDVGGNMNVMLLSVGGTPEPLLKAIESKRPEKIIFFVSQGSRKQVFDEIVPKLDYNPEHHLVVTSDPQDVGICTFTLLADVSKKMKELGCGDMEWPNIVGYTGGTKTMSASVVWASSRFPCEYIYIGGEAGGRTKNGLGIVQDGREQVVSVQNPWDRVAYFEIHDAIELFNSGQYGNAAGRLGEMTKRVTDPHAARLMTTLQFVFAGFHAWDSFDHKKAQGLLKKYIPTLCDLAETEESLVPGLKTFAKDSKELLEILQGIKPGELSNNLIWDLLANALRRAELERKYEDAAARCYAAIEKTAKHVLRRDCGINNNAAQPEQIPDNLRQEYTQRYMFRFDEDDGSVTEKLRFGFAASYWLLNALGHRLGKRFAEREEEIMAHIEARNHSILAHGITTAEKDDFEALFEDALYLLKIKREELIEFPSFHAQT